MTRWFTLAALLLLVLGLLGTPTIATARPVRPEAVLVRYFDALRADRVDLALQELSNAVGGHFFSRSFTQVRGPERTASAEAWNAALKDKEHLLRLLPYWRQSAFRITPVRTLEVGRHARVWFTYTGESGAVTEAFQDFILEEGAWRIALML
jgi:hypothetical protein